MRDVHAEYSNLSVSTYHYRMTKKWGNVDRSRVDILIGVPKHLTELERLLPDAQTSQTAEAASSDAVAQALVC